MTDNEFCTFVTQLQQQFPNQRVLPFEFKGQRYWLKQVEKLQGRDKWSKGNPKKAFERERDKLHFLNKMQAPVPQLILEAPTYFVLQDVGTRLDHILKEVNPTQYSEILQLAGKTLAELHQKDLIHGRPALRDMTYLNGKISFIDFEAPLFSRHLEWQKVRDLLLLLHNMFKKQVDKKEIEGVLQAYRQENGESVYQMLNRFIHKTRGLFYLMKSFQPIAGGDLLAALRLYPFILEKSH